MKILRIIFQISIVCLGGDFALGMVVEGRPTGGSEKRLGVGEILGDFESSDSGFSEFPFADRVGVVGKGSGVYLGDGWVLTSAHVGCHPFVQQGGASFQPVRGTWRLMENEAGESSDLAVYRIVLPPEGSTLSDLEVIPFSPDTPDLETPLVLAGTGFIQQKTPATLTSNGKVLAQIGYRTKRSRGVIWGLNTLAEVVPEDVATGEGFMTQCFTTEFGRDQFEAQAAEGDSGGAIFAWSDGRQRWELAGCIIAVSQQSDYVPYGSKTFSANLAKYRDQLPNAEVNELHEFPEIMVAEEQDVSRTSGVRQDDIETDEVIELPAALYVSSAFGC